MKDGVVLSTNGTKQGTWKLAETVVHVTWIAQAWDTFNRPLNAGPHDWR